MIVFGLAHSVAKPTIRVSFIKAKLLTDHTSRQSSKHDTSLKSMPRKNGVSMG